MMLNSVKSPGKATILIRSMRSVDHPGFGEATNDLSSQPSSRSIFSGVLKKAHSNKDLRRLLRIWTGTP